MPYNAMLALTVIILMKYRCWTQNICHHHQHCGLQVVVLPINSGREISCLISSIICPPARAGHRQLSYLHNTNTLQQHLHHLPSLSHWIKYTEPRPGQEIVKIIIHKTVSLPSLPPLPGGAVVQWGQTTASRY